MKRLIAITALPLLLGGCLPLPVTIASTAISGISYLATGKFSTDHVISAAANQDCALTRPIVGEAVCRDLDPNDNDADDRVIVAYFPGDRDNGAFRNFRDPRMREGAMKLDELPQGPAQVAVALPFASAPAAPIETPGLVASHDVVTPVPEARPVRVSAPATPWVAPKPIANLELAKVTTDAAEVVPSIVVPAVVVPGGAASSDGSVYVVIGSVRDHDRATGLAARYAAFDPSVRDVVIDGTTWSRVVVGPFAPTEARAVKTEIGTVDGKTPWIVSFAPRIEQVAMN